MSAPVRRWVLAGTLIVAGLALPALALTARSDLDGTLLAAATGYSRAHHIAALLVLPCWPAIALAQGPWLAARPRGWRWAALAGEGALWASAALVVWFEQTYAIMGTVEVLPGGYLLALTTVVAGLLGAWWTVTPR